MAGKVPPQFLPGYKKAAPAPSKPAQAPVKSAGTSAGGDAVTKGDVTLLRNILQQNNIPAPKATKIVQEFRKGNS